MLLLIAIYLLSSESFVCLMCVRYTALHVRSCRFHFMVALMKLVVYFRNKFVFFTPTV